MIDQQTTDQLDNYIERNLERYLDELSALCAQPSVSAQNLGIQETAEFVKQMLVARGFESRIIPLVGGHPVVYAETAGAADSTIIFYNHYDVQPPEPLDLWETPPFEPSIRDGKMYARGVSDDKGHIVSRLAAIDAVKDVTGRHPARIKFLIEGEEEIGSPRLEPFVEANRDLLAADACVWESGGVDPDGRPQFFLGMRGICYLQLSVRTASRDAHSGLGGSIFPNAAWRLTWALASLKGPDETIGIPGFYDDVVPPSQRDREMLAAQPSYEDSYRDVYDLAGFLNGVTGLEFKEAAVFHPTCTIAGVTTGYQGAGAKTVLPAAASAKVDFRLVPRQDPFDIAEKVRRHFDAEGFEDVEVECLAHEHPARVDPDDPFVQTALDAARRLYQAEPVVEPLVGGSGPMYPFAEYLKVPIITPGVGHFGSQAHAPNENMLVSEFVRGTKLMARILAAFPNS